MFKLSRIHFHPEWIVWTGAAILTGGVFMILPFLLLLYCDSSCALSLTTKREEVKVTEPIEFTLGLKEMAPFLPITDLQSEMTFSFDPPRPNGTGESLRLLVRLKKSAESQRVVLPCRLDLEYQREKLRFSKGLSSFWIELSAKEDGQIEGKGLISSLEEGKIDAGTFLAAVEECPIQGPQEFNEGSPFRVLAEARWWGRDLFKEQYEGAASSERLELGANELLELKEGDWLVWNDQRWERSASPEMEKPIAHLQGSKGKNLLLEGWDHNGHIRLSLNPAAPPIFKVKADELFSSVRVRSEKQMSCTLEKQCMVLKTGDWVLKTNGRWKILRKKEEREAFLSGKLFGDLFVFEQINQKQGQKIIQGRLFNVNRTQVAPIEVAAQSARKISKKGKAA